MKKRITYAILYSVITALGVVLIWPGEILNALFWLAGGSGIGTLAIASVILPRNFEGEIQNWVKILLMVAGNFLTVFCISEILDRYLKGLYKAGFRYWLLLAGLVFLVNYLLLGAGFIYVTRQAPPGSILSNRQWFSQALTPEK